MFRLARYLMALVFCSLLLSPQVHACMGAFLETTLFFDAFPELPPDADEDADVIAEVVLLTDIPTDSAIANIVRGLKAYIAGVLLTDMPSDSATAKIVRVLKTSDARVREGKKIDMKFLFTSCDNRHRNGDKGIILAKVGADFFGSLVLCPYSRRSGDGRIFPPDEEVSECPPSKYEYGSAKQIKLKAEKGETEAQIAIRLIHEKRQNAKKKKEEAMKWFFSGGGNMEGATESQEAVKWFKLAAEQRDIDAQYYLGQMYQKGLGVERNDVEAAKWYRLAGEQWHLSAVTSLAKMYQQGQGVEKSDAKAAKLYRLAAEKGDRGAKAALETLGNIKEGEMNIYLLMTIIVIALGVFGLYLSRRGYRD